MLAVPLATESYSQPTSFNKTNGAAASEIKCASRKTKCLTFRLKEVIEYVSFRYVASTEQTSDVRQRRTCVSDRRLVLGTIRPVTERL